MTRRGIIAILESYLQGLFYAKKIKNWAMDWVSKDCVFGTIDFSVDMLKYPIDCWESRDIFEREFESEDGTFIFHTMLLNNRQEIERFNELENDLRLIIEQKKDEIEARAKTCSIFEKALNGYEI